MNDPTIKSMTELPESYSLQTNNVITKDLTVYIGLVFDGALDGEFLEQKYCEFVTKWPVVGGTLVKTTPYSFTTGDLADVQTRHLDSLLASVVEVNYIRSFPLDRPSFFEHDSARDEVFHFNNTSALALPHTSLLSLRITVLKDATLLGFCMSHHMCDGTGAWDVVRYYCDFTNGLNIPDISLPPDYDTKLSTKIAVEDKQLPENPEIVTDPKEMFTLGAFPYVKYMTGTIWRLWGPFKEPVQEGFIYLPIELVEKWQKDCQEQVDQELEEGQESTHLTKNDIITAWYLKQSFKTFTRPQVAANLSYAMDVRPFLEDTKKTYLKNAVLDARIHLSSIGKLQAMSHARFALHVHRTVQAFQQPSVLRAIFQFWEEVIDKSLSLTPLPKEGADSGTRGVVSSWTTFRYDKLHLRGALRSDDKKDDGGENSKLGQCVYVQPWVVMPGGALAKPYALTVRDGDRGFWMRTNNTVEAWKNFDQDLQ